MSESKSESLVQVYCSDCDDWHASGECPDSYVDSSGHKHTLWMDAEGNGHARIDNVVYKGDR